MNIDALTEAARTWYDINHADRHYHNWGHANTVAINVYKITNHAPSEELVLAAWWHDAVYVPNAGSDANERCSSAALGLTARIYQDSHTKVIVDKAMTLIKYTSIDMHLLKTSLSSGTDIARLLDADLGSLAAPYDDFVYNQDSIIQENGGTLAVNHKQSAAFLEKFLTCREFIYHTDYGREHWEKQARENIERYCNS